MGQERSRISTASIATNLLIRLLPLYALTRPALRNLGVVMTFCGTGRPICRHRACKADRKVARLSAKEGGVVTGYMAEVSVNCAE